MEELDKDVFAEKTPEPSLIDSSLNDELVRQKRATKARISSKMIETMQQASEQIAKFDFKAHTLKIGDVMPDATLLSTNGKEVQLYDLIDKQKAIITFYRGSWCPYCSLELRYYDQLLALPENRGVKLIAISPELPEITSEERDLSEFHFMFYSDRDNRLAKELNLAFELPEKLHHLYLELGINLEANQGNLSGELPVPATFVVDMHHKVKFVDLDIDYTSRPEPKQVLEAYNNIE